MVFEADSGLVRTIRYARNECPQQAFEYYEIPTTQGTYLAVDVLGFVNARASRPTGDRSASGTAF